MGLTVILVATMIMLVVVLVICTSTIVVISRITFRYRYYHDDYDYYFAFLLFSSNTKKTWNCLVLSTSSIPIAAWLRFCLARFKIAMAFSQARPDSKA